jgi:membrane peptidoglycan carboxypeptidase
VIVYVPNIDPTWVSDPRVAGSIDQNVEIHQPGSSFKPAVYLTWFDALNKSPMSTIWDTNPINLIDKPKRPEDQVTISNPGRAPSSSSQGLITARAALGGSQNVPAFRAATEAGVDNIILMAKALGITTLDQRFDPTFRDHNSVIYGPAIATGGANVRPIDMAYMEATISNMGVMVGVPTYASTLDPKNALSLSTVDDDQKEKALTQRDAFAHGHLRLPGTRTLDPVVVLRVESADGNVLYDSTSDATSRPVVNAGSVWLLHSIMSDCTARFLIWPCGTSNDDLSLDSFVNGVKIPGGVKTGTQQGATAVDTLETWMTGYSRYASTVVWIGNADKSPVRDGPAANYASANTTVRLFKHWMGAYHAHLQELGVFKTPAGFDDVKPANVTSGPFQSATTERGMGGGCGQRVTGWQRTDINYLGGDCLGKGCVPLPEFKKELAIALARSRGIPGCGVALPPPPAPSDTPTVEASPAGPSGTHAPARPIPTGTASPPSPTPKNGPAAPKTPADGATSVPSPKPKQP